MHLARADAASALPRKAFDLSALIEHEVALSSLSGAREGAVRISVSLSEAWVMGDATQMARLVRNLLENAVRHATSTVAVATVVMGEIIRLTIDDDGTGIPQHERIRVFERFARLDEARAADSGGTGLGLAIAHDIVDRHGGTISIETSPLGGARLVIHLLATAPGGEIG